MGVLVFVIGDGKHEVGDVRDKPVAGDDLPALPRLIEKILSKPGQLEFHCRSWLDIKHTRQSKGKGPKYAKKLQLAALRARELGAKGVVALVDRDGEGNRLRLRELETGRREIEPAHYVHCAVGMAIESFDAWMIADESAMRIAGFPDALSPAKPEDLSDPKGHAAEHLGGIRGLAARYAAIARHVDIDLLKRKCPRGFEPFIGEVRSLAPSLCTDKEETR